jgi:hypothetical protein
MSKQVTDSTAIHVQCQRGEEAESMCILSSRESGCVTKAAAVPAFVQRRTFIVYTQRDRKKFQPPVFLVTPGFDTEP